MGATKTKLTAVWQQWLKDTLSSNPLWAAALESLCLSLIKSLYIATTYNPIVQKSHLHNISKPSISFSQFSITFSLLTFPRKKEKWRQWTRTLSWLFWWLSWWPSQASRWLQQLMLQPQAQHLMPLNSCLHAWHLL